MISSNEQSSITGARRIARFLTASIARELGILLCLSVMFPFMVHVLPVPGDARWGPRLLPMFYAPLLAALWGRVRSAVAVALLAPWLNWALTGYPVPAGAGLMMVELSGFVFVLCALLRGVGPRWYLAAPAYIAGKMAGCLVAGLVPALVDGRPALAWALQSAAISAPGVAILVLINWLALRFYPPGAAAA